MSPNRWSCPEDLVLDLQVLELPGQFSMGRTGNEKQERLVNVGHRTRVRKMMLSMVMAIFSHPADGRSSRIFSRFFSYVLSRVLVNSF